ncbi:MAG: ImmA/IrrE family metallo-endopeptidase, partial [candidate division Zixibacteria bacterium]|nr:ImmA/IrrE family metallo-endopeptidase [candidate division Zixibacteria bacterium]
ITPETAILLERTLGVPSGFWNNRQRLYDEFVARIEEQKYLQTIVAWVKHFPYASMVKLGWVPKAPKDMEKLEHLLTFFGVGDPKAWEDYWTGIQVAYRKSRAINTNEYALAAWLRRGELVSRGINCQPYNPDNFKNILMDIRQLTIQPPQLFRKQLIDICASAGVAVVFVPELPKTASGATRWLTPDKALIQLSLRYKTDDHLWFTFFHEAAHVLFHPKRDIFIQDKETSGKYEDQANSFAKDTLIPHRDFQEFVSGMLFTSDSIRVFAQHIKIAPGIVVGRLQKEGYLPWNSSCNHLKRKLEWVKAA